MKPNKTTLLFGIFLSLSLSCNSQIIYLEGEDAKSPRISNSSIDITNPWEHGLGIDVYVPLGNSTLLLTSLGMLYLWRKRKKE